MKTKIQNRLIDTTIFIILMFVVLITLYPFWNALVISFNKGLDTAKGGITIWPRAFTLDNYRVVVVDPVFLRAIFISVARVAAGTTTSIFFTAMMAYGLSKSYLVGQKQLMKLSIITMYFGGGIIPLYLLIHSLGLIDTFSALFIPHLIGVYNVIVFRSFFLSLPASLEEAAKIDGCNHIQIFFKIVLQTSKPIIATLSLFHAVFLWNDYFNAGLYISNVSLLPVQNYLMNVINSSNYAEVMAQLKGGVGSYIKPTVTGKSLQMATLMVSTLPIILVYPFVQKYFVKGVMIGSIKE